MHSVYSRPEDVTAFRRDGKFPDGAVLVKEVTKVGSEKLTAGEAHGPPNPSSGSCWSRTRRDDSRATTCGATAGAGASSWRTTLQRSGAPITRSTAGCHIPAQKDDWLYVRVYPCSRKGD